MFGFGKSEDSRFELPPEPYDPARALAELFKARKRMLDGLIRPENLLNVTAAVTGEFCIRVAGEFDADRHSFFPGSRIESDKVDQLLFAGQKDWATLPETTIFGTIRDGALHRGYVASDFPALTDILRQPVEGATTNGVPARPSGRVPLNIGRHRLPKLSPLQEAFLMRELVLIQMSNWGASPNDQALICARATAMLLGFVKDAIDPKIALQIAFATVSGMAKMAPMTALHAAKMNLKVGKGRVVF
jgi:hypothetical protein